VTLRHHVAVEYQAAPVFVLPPWKAIYVTDAERDHTFEHAEAVDRITQEWYRRWLPFGALPRGKTRSRSV
jgi:predicted ATPase